MDSTQVVAVALMLAASPCQQARFFDVFWIAVTVPIIFLKHRDFENDPQLWETHHHAQPSLLFHLFGSVRVEIAQMSCAMAKRTNGTIERF